jgi:hypothetical protein
LVKSLSEYEILVEKWARAPAEMADSRAVSQPDNSLPGDSYPPHKSELVGGVPRGSGAAFLVPGAAAGQARVRGPGEPGAGLLGSRGRTARGHRCHAGPRPRQRPAGAQQLRRRGLRDAGRHQRRPLAARRRGQAGQNGPPLRPPPH